MAKTSANVPLDKTSTPWLAASTIVAMRQSGDLEIAGVVDKIALEGVGFAQTVMSGWYPKDMSEIEIDAQDVESPELVDSRGVGCFFSGGVDSFYSTVKHLEEITHLIFIHGFDISLDNVDLAERTLAALRKSAADLGKPLIEVRTNLRQVHATFGLDWKAHSHGALLAHVALLLSPHLSRVYVPASVTSEDYPPYGTHPDLDPLWSSSGVEIIHDGIDATRAQKVNVFADNDAAMDNLRVCWFNKENDYNCGKCEKCIRTLMNIRIAGASGRCSTLPAEVPLDIFSRTYLDKSAKKSAIENLTAMSEMGWQDPELEAALKSAVNRPVLTNELFHARDLALLIPEFAKFMWSWGTSSSKRKTTMALD